VAGGLDYAEMDRLNQTCLQHMLPMGRLHRRAANVPYPWLIYGRDVHVMRDGELVDRRSGLEVVSQMRGCHR
jgi:hypothetical protein